MAGRAVSSTERRRVQPKPGAQILMSVQGLACANGYGPFSFELKAGEVLGVFRTREFWKNGITRDAVRLTQVRCRNGHLVRREDSGRCHPWKHGSEALDFCRKIANVMEFSRNFPSKRTLL